MPKFLEDPLKAYRYIRDGATNFSGDQYMTADEFTNAEIFWQSIGFVPASLQHNYDLIRGARNTETRLIQRQQSLLDQMFLAARAKDRNEIRRVRAQVMDFNRANPRARITGATIRRSIDAKRGRSERASRSRSLVMRDNDHRYLLEQFHLTE